MTPDVSEHECCSEVFFFPLVNRKETLVWRKEVRLLIED